MNWKEDIEHEGGRFFVIRDLLNNASVDLNYFDLWIGIQYYCNWFLVRPLFFKSNSFTN